MNTQLDFSHSHQLYSGLNHLISSTPILSLEEEQACAICDTDDAREQLVLSHLRLVRSIAFGFTGCGVDVKDLFSQGMVGLMKAVDRYVPSRGRLATYAEHFILGEITCYLNKARTSFHLPDRLHRSVNKFRRVCRKLGEGATDTEIAAEMRCSVEHVSCFRECSEQTFESLDAPLVDSPDEETLSDTLGSVDPGFDEVDTKLTVAQLMSQLSPVEREVICLHHGIDGVQLSFRDIGARLGKSHTWVSKIEKTAMAKLRKRANYSELEK